MRTAEEARNRYGFAVACVLSYADGKEDVPTRNAKVASGAKALMWKAPIEFETDSLSKLETWNQMTLPPRREVI